MFISLVVIVGTCEYLEKPVNDTISIYLATRTGLWKVRSHLLLTAEEF